MTEFVLLVNAYGNELPLEHPTWLVLGRHERLEDAAAQFIREYPGFIVGWLLVVAEEDGTRRRLTRAEEQLRQLVAGTCEGPER